MSKHRDYCLALALIFGLGFALTPLPALAAKCVTKAGSATGITRGFAEYEAFLIIRQASGNWPIQTDQISKPAYKCSQKNMMWNCFATAKVCKN